MKATLLPSFLFLVLAPVATWSADLSSSGNWTKTIGASDLVAGAGSDLIGQHDSDSGVATLTISHTGGASWRLFARRSDGSWHERFQLFVRRTSDGAGPGAVSGGESHVALSTLDTEFFSGSGDRTDIAIQYRLTGMSKTVAPDLYSSGILFTLLLE